MQCCGCFTTSFYGSGLHNVGDNDVVDLQNHANAPAAHASEKNTIDARQLITKDAAAAAKMFTHSLASERAELDTSSGCGAGVTHTNTKHANGLPLSKN
jgi:hypothetical protein